MLLDVKMIGTYRSIPALGQLGISDTPLTSALEKGDFKTAEKLILENQEPAYLDDGPFENIPLALVLSNETEFREHRRHLRLAKLLVEGGANPNLRILQSEMVGVGANASPSPMEFLLELYDLCRCHNNDKAEDKDCYEFYSLAFNKVNPLFTIGLHNEVNLSPSELKEQLLQLLDVFLAYGGNPNVTTTISNSTLFHIAVSNPDPEMELVMKLCEAGGDLNLKNIHGTTPLMDLISYAEADLAMDVIHSIRKVKPDISSLQDHNCSNETALWKAMKAGSPEVAVELLQKGASPVPRAIVTIGKWRSPTRSEKLPLTREIVLNGVSFIFAPLLQDSSPNLRYTSVRSATKFDGDEPVCPFNVYLLDKVFSCTISPVVDVLPAVQCFPEPVLQEVMSVISEETNFRSQSLLTTAIRPQDLALLIFGKLSAGLQQMCVRVIMDTVFISQEARKALAFIAQLSGKSVVSHEEMNMKMGDDAKSNAWDNEDNNEELGSSKNVNREIQNFEKSESKVVDVEEIVETVNKTNFIVVQDHSNITQWNVIMELDRIVIQKLVEGYLKLPGSLVTRFIVEAIRLQLGAALYAFESTNCIQGCDEESDESSDPFDTGTEDSEDGEESEWSAEFMSSDEYSDFFINSDMEWENNEGEEEENNEEEDNENVLDGSSGSRNEDHNDITERSMEDSIDMGIE